MRLAIRILYLLVALLPAAEVQAFHGCTLAADGGKGADAEVSTEGLTPHFRAWLQGHGYTVHDFPRDDLKGGSFGGKSGDEDPLRHQPVVFVHGNSAQAVGVRDGTPLGWTAVIRYFLDQGYTPAELYATTWGPADPSKAAAQIHSRENLERIRAFIEAVLAYTGAEKLDLIAHSMGVTLARRAIQGGLAHDSKTGEDYNLGLPLTDRIDTFVGIAGANLGLASCFLGGWSVPTCSARDGFFPGYPSFFGAGDPSAFLRGLNATQGYEGAHVFSIWSRADELIGYGGLVYGRYTSRIPAQEGEKVYNGYPYGHFCVRDLTAPVQLEMILEHRLP